MLPGWGLDRGSPASWGYGAAVAGTFVVIPVEQAVEAIEVLIDAGAQEHEISVQSSDFNTDVAIIEVTTDNENLTPSQIASALSRSLDVEVKEITMSTDAKDVTQTVEFRNVVQSVAVEENDMQVAVVNVDGEIETQDSIDKRE